jgi:hypothetical protein
MLLVLLLSRWMVMGGGDEVRRIENDLVRNRYMISSRDEMKSRLYI